MKFPDLPGERIDLVEINASCIDDLHEYSSMPVFFEFMELIESRSREETETYYQKLVRRSQAPTGHYWMIRHKGDDKVIGTFGVLDIDTRKGSCEIGYGVSPQYWGKGYFKEVLRMVLEYLFDEAGFHRVWAKTQDDNAASINSLKSLGFKHEGTLRDFYLSEKNGVRNDAVVLAILRPEFSAGKAYK
ncbi:MAG: GNAT family N-acetyltransferase [Rhodospirillales bacterium]|nr:GNAT family N-acetyltransferase [Rhodospirillales bacterium]